MTRRKVPVAMQHTYRTHLNMIRSQRVLRFIVTSIVAVSTVSCAVSSEKRMQKRNDYGDKTLWKKEYENELTDAMLTSRKRDNKTRVAQSANLSDNEGVVEKLLDTITASEKYLKKVDSIDFRLNRLDIEVHERTNNIMKHLTEIFKRVDSDVQSEKLEIVLKSLKNDVNKIKFMIENRHRTNTGNKCWTYELF